VHDARAQGGRRDRGKINALTAQFFEPGGEGIAGKELAALLGCDIDMEKHPRRHALFVLIGQALIGAAHAGTLSDGLLRLFGDRGGLPVYWIQPKGT